MDIIKYTNAKYQVAEIVSNKLLITGGEDALDFMGKLYFQSFNVVIIHSKNITQTFSV